MSKKVTLVVRKGFGTERNPYLGMSLQEIETEVELEDNQYVRRVIIPGDVTGERPPSNDPVMPLEFINNLVGKVLTVVDASYSDKEQRKAVKDLMTQSIWGWYDNHR